MDKKSERVTYILGTTRMSRDTLSNQDKADIVRHCLQNLELSWMSGFLPLNEWLSHVSKDPEAIVFEHGVRRDASVLLLTQFRINETARELNFLYIRHDNSGRLLGSLGTRHSRGMGAYYYDPLRVWNIEEGGLVALLELHGDELFVRFLQQLETRTRKSAEDHQESARRLRSTNQSIVGIMRRVDCSPDFDEE